MPKPKPSPKKPRGKYVQLTIHIHRKWYDALVRVAAQPQCVKLGVGVEALAALAAEAQIHRSEEERLDRVRAGEFLRDLPIAQLKYVVSKIKKR